MLKKIAKTDRHGLLINITGDGKGKTTSALGTALRALGWGWQVTAIQFIKSGSTDTGEKQFADRLELPFEIITLGAGFTWNRKITEAEHIKGVQAAWQLASDYIINGKVDLLILDELNIALDKKWLNVAEVIKVLQQRPAWMHIIITGRNAGSEIIEAADLVSEVKELKHPFKFGITAQQGIEF
jgi:cob(I)alamin adenosyltransferase